MKTSEKILIVLLTISIVLCCFGFLASCEKGDKVANITVTDMAGREIKFDKAPEKVVCIGAGALRLYSYVGDMDKLYAVEEIEGSRTSGRVSLRAYQIAYEDKFRALLNDNKKAGAGGPAAQILNTEVLAALQPDVIFSCLSLSDDELDAGEKAIGCPIVTLRYDEQKAFGQGIQQSMRIIDTLCGKDNKAETLIAYMEALKADIATLSNGKTSKKLYLACNSNWGVKGFLSTAKNYPLFTISNITNVMDGTGVTINNGYADEESVITSGAERILLDAGGLNVFKGEYEEEGGHLPTVLATMPAFRDKEVYLMMPNNAYDANVEMYFINAYYALSVAYDVELDIRAKANEITNAFLGKELYDDITIYGGYRKLNLPDVWPMA